MTMKICFVELNDAETLALSKQLVARLVEHDGLLEGQRDEKARMTDERKKLEAEVRRLTEILKAGKEERELDVEEILDQATLEVIWKEIATGRIVNTRPMTQAELDREHSPELPFGAAPPDPPPDPDDDDALDIEVEDDDEDEDEDEEEEEDAEDLDAKPAQRYPKRRGKAKAKRPPAGVLSGQKRSRAERRSL